MGCALNMIPPRWLPGGAFIRSTMHQFTYPIGLFDFPERKVGWGRRELSGKSESYTFLEFLKISLAFFVVSQLSTRTMVFL